MFSIGVSMMDTFQKYYFLTNVFLFSGLLIGIGSALLVPLASSFICAISDGRHSITKGILLHHLVSEILVCEILVGSSEKRLKFGLFVLGYGVSLVHNYLRLNSGESQA